MTRLVVNRWLIAIAVGIFGILIQRQPAHLTDPASCPGLLEWMAIAASRSASRVPVATFLAWLNAAGVFLSLVALTRWIERGAGGLLAGASVSLAAAATLVTTPVLAPAHVLAVGAASAAWLALDNSAATPLWSRQLLAWLALGLTAAIAPALAFPLAVAAAWFAWHTSDSSRWPSRLLASAMALVVVLAWPVVQTMTMPALPAGDPTHATSGCVIPGAVSVQQIWPALGKALSGTGPLPMALAVLAVFSLRDRIARIGTWSFVLVAALPLVAASWEGSEASRTLAPTIAGFWWMAGAGMREIGSALTGRPAWRIGAWIIALLFPLLQWSHRSAVPIAPADEPRGQETLTRRDFSYLLNALPTRSTLVIDDAISDVLLRSTAGTVQQSGKVLSLVARDGREAARAAIDGRLFALPRAQFDLQHQGLARAESSGPPIPGLVAFTRAGECASVESQWLATKDLSRSSRLAVVSDRPDARGPVIIYLGSHVAFDVHPIDWPGWTMRGYHSGTYDRAKEPDRLRLDRDRSGDGHDRSGDGAPADDPVFGHAFLARLELWRVPNGPMMLPVGLGQPPEAALIRATTPGDRGSLRVCPSFPGEIVRLEVRRPD
ncbi:MAG TPA: hypothetical protein VES67_18255 [Vicinamibacterales bacterium]|nr:hypothetical protein [Vicinamibacterales bacterium]